MFESAVQYGYEMRKALASMASSFLLFLLLLLSAGLAATSTTALSSQKVEVDVTATVYKVVDGDTLDAFPVGRVRLADIDAPELGEAWGREAKEALTGLTFKKKVYLDVDDLYVMDKYNRLIAVVYIRHNETHLLNVNLFLVMKGHAVIVDFPNEFDPKAWMLYVRYVEEDYEKLLGGYKTLKLKYEALMEKHSRLWDEYSKLLEEQELLKSDHEELGSSHEELLKAHERLKATYDELSKEYVGLESDYKKLRSSYEELSKAFEGLKSSYETALSDLKASSTYATLTTIVLIAIGAIMIWRKLRQRYTVAPSALSKR